MLLEEVEKRSNIRWKVSNELSNAHHPSILLGRRSELVRTLPQLANGLNTAGSEKPEGYLVVRLNPTLIVVAGNDARGVLYGAGRLLQLLDYGREKVSLAPNVNITSSPAHRSFTHSRRFWLRYY